MSSTKQRGLVVSESIEEQVKKISAADLPQEIEQAKKDAKSFKDQIEKAKQASNDADLKEFTSSTPLNLQNMKCKSVLKGHLSKIYCVDWCADNTHLVSASQDGRMIVWNAKTNYKIHSIPLTSNWIMTCAFAPSGNMVACGGLDNTCSIFNISNATPTIVSSNNVGSGGGNGNNNSGGGNVNNNNGVMNPNDMSDIKVSKTLVAHNGYLSDCEFISDRHIITSSGDQSCMHWDIEMGQVLTKFTGHLGDVMNVNISPDHNMLVSGSCDKTAKIWDIRSGKCVQTISGHHTSDVNSVRFFPNGLLIGTGSEDQTCSLFDMRANQTLTIFEDDTLVKEPVTSLSFSKSGRLMFTSYEDKKIIVWDTMTAKPVKTLTGHENSVSHVQVSPNGCALISASWDHTIRVWTV